MKLSDIQKVAKDFFKNTIYYTYTEMILIMKALNIWRKKNGVPKIGVGCGKQTKISHAAQKKYGQSNKNKTHIARGIGPTVKKI